MVDINKNPPWFRTASQCRYSGLPVSHPDIFVSKHPGANYFVDIAKLGDHSILVKASGYVHSYEMSEALRFMDDYVSKYFDIKTGVLLIEDYADVEGADFKARKKYIEHHKHSDVFWGGILYNLPLIFRISFKIAKRLHVHGKHLYAVDSFEQAIAFAEEITIQRNTADALCHDYDSDAIFSPEKQSEASESLLGYAEGKLRDFRDMFTTRFSRNITRQYSETLLKYIESIDWHKDGVDPPEVPDTDDKSLRKVFNAVSYIKDEIDSLLKERDVVEQELRESEARYRQLVEHAKAGILEFDYQTNRIISFNDSFREISGYTEEELFSVNPMDLLTEESRKIYAKRHSQRLSGEKISPDSAYQFICKSGHSKWVLLNTNISYKDDQLWKAEVVLTDITQLKEVENELVNYQSKLKQLSVQLSRSEENQRRQLASRLHESVSQELFAAQLKLNALEKSLDDSQYSSQIEDIKDQIVKSIKDIRGITYDLSPPVLYDLGLKEAVESLAKSITAQYRLPVKTRFNGSLENMDDEIKIITYRVIREIVQNAIKHAQASFIDIIVDKKNNTLSVDVTDNGIGFDADTLSEGQYGNDGFGLFDIREKINHLGGLLTIHSKPGSGTRIGLSVPLKDIVIADLKN
jgi:PAS domain S-box-containing protein